MNKTGIIHAAIGQLGFAQKLYVKTLKLLIADLKRLKPAASKGVYVKKITLSSTMGYVLLLAGKQRSK